MEMELETLLESAEVKSEIKVLPEDKYSAICVGHIVRSIESAGVSKQTFELVFQVFWEDHTYYLRTKALTLSLNDKSNFYKLMKSWLKFSDNNDLINKLRGLNVVVNKDGKEVISLDGFKGINVLIFTGLHVNNGKTYPMIVNVLMDNNSIDSVVPDTVPNKLFNWDGKTTEISLFKEINIQ